VKRLAIGHLDNNMPQSEMSENEATSAPNGPKQAQLGVKFDLPSQTPDRD